MSTVPLVAAFPPCLADVVEESLSAALSGGEQRCLWCGSRAVEVSRADIWTGEVTARCGSCGSELSGVVRRELRVAREAGA